MLKGYDFEQTSHMMGLIGDVCSEFKIGVMCRYCICTTLPVIHILYRHPIVVEYTSNHEVAINSGSGMTTNILVYGEIHFSWWRHQMETFPRYGPYVWGIHRSRWNPLTKASNAELWCFLWFVCEHMVEQTFETLLIRNANALIMTSP